MAASTVVPTRAHVDPRALVAGAAARSAPRGPGLAPVIALPSRRPVAVAQAGSPVADQPVGAPSRPALTVVAPVRSRRVRPGRLVAVLLAGALLLGVADLTVGALAAPELPAVSGHVVLQPGETLWDIAVRSAPVGTDPREQLDTLRRLNGLGPGALDAWTVVLLPAV